MIIDISKISQLCGASLQVHISEDIEKLEFGGKKVAFIKPVELTGNITNLKDVYILEGKITSTIRTNCDRCLEEFDYDINIDISEKFAYEVKSDLDDITIFHGDIIDVLEVVKNNLIMNFPIQYICKENCKGLCSQCGINKNTVKCDCKGINVDPRLEKLKSLFNIK